MIKINLRILILINVILLFVARGAFSDQRSAASRALMDTEILLDSYGDDVLGQIKKEAVSVEKINKELEHEHDIVNKELNIFAKTIAQYKKKIISLKADLENLEGYQENSKDSFIEQKSLQKLEDNILINKSKNIYLKGQLMDADEELRLKKMKLADSEYNLRQEKLDYKIKKHAFNEEQRRKKVDNNKLRKELQGNLNKTIRIEQSLSDIGKRSAYFSESIQRLAEENKRLEDKIGEIEERKDFKSKEVSLLKKKIEFARKSLEVDVLPKEKKIRGLIGNVNKLNKEYNFLNDSLKSSLIMRDEKRDLMKKIIEHDKENQELIDKILLLEEKPKDYGEYIN
ncbi:MAG: hypothetical protein P9X22_06190 [Candidatus Zapsychrus exili]|nr:hypothetical protein [Candidatus Zapsychrus exili]